MAKHDYMGFSETLEEDDYGIIIGKDGTVKGIWVPRHLENEEQLPAAIANMCEDTFGIDPNDQSNYHTLH
jgi:hypothetical protein